ncbi:MAG: nucleotide sugar dehydrogenase [Tateyamaria sp.]|uniref:nucleotide sugar dehydrogenase n=1 Tax=Rhodobacterales TaxID=204455 RepID=UPI00327F07D5
MILHRPDALNVAVIGLGYVGLPLAAAFGAKRPTLGFDINTARIEQLRRGDDATQEMAPDELLAAHHLTFSDQVEDLAACNTYIIAVPTPIDAHKRPDLSPLLRSSETVADVLRHGDLVIYESTVFPGATEEVCVPILEQRSGLKLNRDFFVGYSPERINPGDKVHQLASICKVVSGSTPEATALIEALYAEIITAGTYKANSIRVAEAAKVIENTQRDLNIALINELAVIFNKLGLDTEAVLQTAGTKWNFLPFRPGLVGGHCIGVDPYYLTHKAQEIGHHPEIILAGRRINDRMSGYVASQMVKAMLHKGINMAGAHVLILGITFKENCPDVRNSKVVDVVHAFEEYGLAVDVYDPNADATATYDQHGLSLCARPETGRYDGILLAVPHTQFRSMYAADIRAYGKSVHVFYDMKSVFSKSSSDLRL